MASVTDADLPALYRAADRASVASQKTYLRFVRGDLALIVASAVCASWAVSSLELRAELAGLGAVAFIAGLILTLLLLQTRPDEQWFGGRAIAESVKTIAWRYMMCAEPYQKSIASEAADRRFSEELRGILRERSALGASLGGGEAAGEQITQRMRAIRSEELADRARIYVESRIRDQRAWYAGKANVNKAASTRWLVLVAITQLAGAGAAIALIVWPDLGFDLAGILAAAAAALLAWLQVKQHQSLAQAYGLAAHELGLIEAQACHVSTEEAFSSFVADAEAAISREHTMWVARRDVVL